MKNACVTIVLEEGYDHVEVNRKSQIAKNILNVTEDRSDVFLSQFRDVQGVPYLVGVVQEDVEHIELMRGMVGRAFEEFRKDDTWPLTLGERTVEVTVVGDGQSESVSL